MIISDGLIYLGVVSLILGIFIMIADHILYNKMMVYVETNAF